MSTAAEHDQLAALVDEFLMLVAESAEYHRHEQVRAVLGEAQATLMAIRKRLRLARHRFVVAVVGLSNVGKSTLLNALLGADLAPRRNGPCTAAPVEFVHGDELRLIAHHHNSLRRPTHTCSTAEAVHHHLAQFVDSAGAEASRQIRRVVVEVPHPLLTDGLVIADTPGFGAGQLDEADGTHEQALKRYLRNDVAQVFWVVLAEQGIGRREMQFHDQLFADVCDDVLVTGCEDWDAQDRQRFRRRFAARFAQRMPAFHFVSGLAGVEARGRGDDQALEEAGIPDLERRIRELADPVGRTQASQDHLCQLAEDLGFWLHEFRDERDQPLPRWWRPDSWSRWRDNTADTPLSLRLTNALETSS